jgi:hypothetical protein
MGCGASAQSAAVVEAPVKDTNDAPVKPEVKSEDNGNAAVDSEVSTATPQESDDDLAKQKKEEEAAALKIQSNHRGKQARKEVAAKKADKEGADKPDEAAANTEGVPKDEPSSNAPEPALTAEEAAKQKAEEEAAALKIQSNHRGKQARKEVAAKKADKEGADKPEDATADTEGVAKEEPSSNAPEPVLTDEEAAKQKAEEEAAALKIQSNHRGKQARKEVASLKDSQANSADDKPADTNAEQAA